MAQNMSHCRFTNTLAALRECYEHMDEDTPSSEEAQAQNALLLLCDRIASDYEDEIKVASEQRARRAGSGVKM